MQFEDISLMPTTQAACKKAVKSFCADVPKGNKDGAVLSCLLGKQHSTDMPSECQHELKQWRLIQASSIRFNPLMQEACDKDLSRLQAAHKCVASELQGSRIDCLTTNRNDISDPSCRVAVGVTLKQQSDDVNSKPRMSDDCADDVAKLCPSISSGKGKLNACLRKQVDQIQSKACKAKVNAVVAVEAENIVINPQIRRRCANEKRAFCSDVSPSSLLTCLVQHQKESSFSKACRLVILRVRHVGAINHTVHVAHAAKSKGFLAEQTPKEILDWLAKNRGIVDKYGVLIFMCIVTMTVLMIGGFAYWLMQRHNKNSYTVVVPRELDA